MKPEDIKPALKVVTAPGLNSVKGMLVPESYLKQRKTNQVARVYGPVPGHGGDVWWLVHEGAATYKTEQGLEMLDKTFIAPYMFTEFNPVKE